MTHGLNLTLPIRQDPETQAALKQLAAVFETEVQPFIEKALRESKLVHFARILVIDNKYIQVITEYDGDHQAYTEFFRRALTPVFSKIFALAEGTPDIKDSNAFWEYSMKRNVRSLGQATDGALDFEGNPAGWLFSAYGDRPVPVIQKAIEKAGS